MAIARPLGDTDCLLCNAPRPVSHSLVRDSRRTIIGRVCGSHTLKELAFSEKFIVDIEYCPEEGDHDPR